MRSKPTYFSYAGDARGKTDPDEIHHTRVFEDECPAEHCTQDENFHLVLMWSGGEYSKNHTWISCEDRYAVNLEDAR